MQKKRGITSLAKDRIKASEFMIAQNPLLDDNRIFVLHTRRPLILCEAHHFKPDQTVELQHCQNNYSIGIIVEFPEQLVYLGVDDMGQSILSSSKVEGILTLMGDWYRAYLMDKLFSTFKA